jgi:ABC-type phosphate transport system substrate-binding protein
MDEREKQLLTRAQKLILSEQYDRARVLLEQIPNNPTAQKYLEKLNRLDPAPDTLKEAQEDLEAARHQIEKAEAEIESTQRGLQRAVQVNYAVLVFLGTLLGSLIGAAADLGGAVDTFERFRRMRYPEICIVGSDTILGDGLGMIEAWTEEFEANNRVRVRINATGSNAGVRLAVNGGCANIIAMSEPMTPEQQTLLNDSGVELTCAAEIGYDLVVFVTDINNPVPSINRPVLSGMLMGQVEGWSQLTTDFDFPVSVLVRKGSGTTDLILRNIGNFDSQGGRVFPALADYEVCDSNEQCLDRTLSTNGALYWTSASWIRTQPPQYLKVLPMLLRDDDAPINPLVQDVDLDDYPADLQRPLYMYVVRDANTTDDKIAASRSFLDYVRGVKGQRILEANFFYNHFDQPSDVDVPLPNGFEPFNVPGRSICR